MLRLGEDCAWSLVPFLVLVNDKMMPPNGNARNMPTCPAQCPPTHCWIGHKWKQSVCQMKLTTFHRTFLAPTGGHPGCMHGSALMLKFVQYFDSTEKTIFKNKDFQALVSTSDGVNLCTLSRSCHHYRGGLRTTVIEIRWTAPKKCDLVTRQSFCKEIEV